jgi:hypothetical protein
MLPCDDVLRCIDRDGTSPLACSDVAGGVCLGQVTAYNAYCASVPGTDAQTVDDYPWGGTSSVCVPYSW